MSQLLVQTYLSELDRIRQVSGTYRETVVREAFKDLLKSWGRQQHLVFLAEYPLKTLTKTNISVDGALLHELRMPLGYWEAKDEKDDLDDEIDKKFRKGYPQDNIIFTDDVTAVLIQNKKAVLRCSMTDTAKLEQLIKLFFSYERPEIASFRAAVEQFKTDLPAVLEALRAMIEKAMLKADKNANAIILDAETTLGGVPAEAWDYKLGSRSALEWILDQYKEKKPKDPTIRERFNTYRFADYKEKVIDLLCRVTTVSVGTVDIVEKMRQVAR